MTPYALIIGFIAFFAWFTLLLFGERIRRQWWKLTGKQYNARRE